MGAGLAASGRGAWLCTPGVSPQPWGAGSGLWKWLGSVHRRQNVGVDAALWNGAGVGQWMMYCGQMDPSASSCCAWSPGQLWGGEVGVSAGAQ